MNRTPAEPVSGGILLLQAIVIAVVLAVTAARAVLPVTTEFGGALTSVEFGPAALVLLVFCSLLRFVPRDTGLIEFSQVSGISVFLVAQLNGISDVTSLVPLYALAAGAVLFLGLHSRNGDRWAYTFGAAVGIVPWGVIAFAQVGAGVVGDSPPVIVRVITLGMLALAIASWAIARLVVARPARTAEGARRALATITPSALAWFAVLMSL